MNNGERTKKHERERDIPNLLHKKAMDTSAIDTVDVIVATNKREKNSNAQIYVPCICIKIAGRVTNTNVVPDN